MSSYRDLSDKEFATQIRGICNRSTCQADVDRLMKQGFPDYPYRVKAAFSNHGNMSMNMFMAHGKDGSTLTGRDAL